MTSNLSRRILSATFVGLMIASTLGVLSSTGGDADAGAPVSPMESKEVPVRLGGAPPRVAGDDTERALAKVAPSLRERALAPSKSFLDVLITTRNLGEARSVAERYGASFVTEDSPVPSLGHSRGVMPATDRFLARDLRVPEAALLGLASLPSTVSISPSLGVRLYDAPDPVDLKLSEQRRAELRESWRAAAKDRMGPAGEPGDPSPTDYPASVVTGSQAVKQAYNITGTPVNILVTDTGTDFGNPSFSYWNITNPGEHKWAIVENQTSDWYGWPIMIDGGSLGSWFGNWDAGSPPYPVGYSFGEASWFADTAYEGQLVGTPLDILVDGDASDWDVGHRVAQDPAADVVGAFDLTDLYVTGGHDANLDVVGHFFGFNTDPAVAIPGTTGDFMTYLDWNGPGTAGFDTLYVNNFTTTGSVLVPQTEWEVVVNLGLTSNQEILLWDAGGQLLSLYREDGVTFVEGLDYTFDPGSGDITFTQPLYPGHILYADFYYAFTDVSGPGNAQSFSNPNLDAGSVTVWLNGAPWTEDPANFTIDYPNGTIEFTNPLGPDDIVEADFTFNSGGTTDPVYAATVSSQPDFPEIVVRWATNSVAGGLMAEPDVYVWTGRAWAAPSPISAIGGEAMWSAAGNFAEFFAPKPNRGDPSSIYVEMFTGDGVGLQDTTPNDPAPLSMLAQTPADFGFLPYKHGLNDWWTKRAAPDLQDESRIDRNYHLDPSLPMQGSLSGTYHLGVSPDDKLTAIWGERVGLLLVDPNVAGTYDTIFVDLDDDHSFADENPVSKSQPVVWQDYTGDGVPDISGGLLYWLPDVSVVQPQENFTGPGINNTAYVNLSKGWVAVDIGAGVSYDLPAVTLNGSALPWMDADPSSTIGVANGTLYYTVSLGNGTVNFWTLTNNYTAEYGPHVLKDTDLVTANYKTGTALPYSPSLSADQQMQNFIPQNGDVALFYGEFNAADNHGTATASAAAGKPFNNSGGFTCACPGALDIYGTAENAKIIGGSFASGNIALEFAGRGYDGIAGTGDEAQISSNSWGYGGSAPVENSGWDANSRYVQYLAGLYPEVLYMFSAANEGFGYGTLGTPAGTPDVLTVGASTVRDWRKLINTLGGGGDAGPLGCYPPQANGPCGPSGDIADFSSRGPSGLGQPKPDIMAPGDTGLAAFPLNDLGYWEGNDAWTLFGGTSWAAPVAAGVAALVAESYYRSHGSTWPTGQQLKEFLMSGASDHKFDPLQQGAGFVDAMRSVQLGGDPSGIGQGVSVSPGNWVPGGYPTPAQSHKAFVNLLRAGESDTDTFTLTNHGPAATTVSLSDGMYVLNRSYGWDYVRQPFSGLIDYWWFNGTGGDVTERHQGAGVSPAVATDFPSAAYKTADFIAVHVTSSVLNQMMAVGDTMTLGMDVHQWTDLNGNGAFNGAERNQVTAFSGTGDNYNVMKTWVHEPAARFDNATTSVNEGPAIRILDFQLALPIQLNVTIEFYQRVDWPWVSVSTSSLTVPANGTATFTAAAVVPTNAAPGSYQGAILVNDSGTVSLIPSLINVPATTFPAQLGGVTPTTSLYENGAFRGEAGHQYFLGGDIRNFFLDLSVDTTRADRRMIYALAWENAFTDAELYAAAPAPYDAGSFEAMDPSVFGPHTLTSVAESKGRRGGQETLSGTDEFISSPLQTGLMMVSVESVRMMGKTIQENFAVDVGMMETKPTSPVISTNELAGSLPVTVWANIPLRDGLGVAVTEVLQDTFPNRTVDSYPYSGTPFISYLLGAPNTFSEMLPTGVTSVKWSFEFHPPATDVDFGVFYDGPTCDGVYDENDNMGGTAAATAVNPESLSLDFPPAGCYWVHAAGFTVGGSALWDETRDIQRVGTSAFGSQGLPTTTIPPLTLSTFNVTWDFPGSTPQGIYEGTLYVSPGYAPFALAQKIAITFKHDTTPPVIQDMVPLPGTTTAVTVPRVVANIFDTIDAGKTELGGEIDWQAIQLWVDGQDVTQQSTVIARYDSTTSTDPPDTNYGYNEATVTFAPTTPMADGLHVATVNAWDYAGNLATSTWVWTVDTAGPSLVITSPAETETFQQGSNASISGTTDAGATVELQIEGAGIVATVDPQGRFSGSVNLLVQGRHEVTVVASDAWGNSVSEALVFWYDPAPPSITWSISPAQTTNADTAIILGTVNETVSLTANGVPVFVGADGSWSVTWLLSEGTNTAVLRAVDPSGRVTTQTVVLTRITAPPTITASALDASGNEITEAIQDASINTVDIAGTATVSPGTTLRFVLVNGAPATLGPGGAFTLPDAPLNVGANIFNVQAQDSAGNWATASVTVSYTPIRLEVARSYNSILLAVVAVVLLVVGLFVGMMMGRKPSQPEGMPPGPPMMPMEAMPPPMEDTMPAGEPSAPSPEEMPPAEPADPSKEGMQ